MSGRMRFCRIAARFASPSPGPTQSFTAKFGDEFKGYAQAKKAPRPDGVAELV